MTINNEKRAHDLAIAIIGSEDAEEKNGLFNLLEEEGKYEHDESLIIKYKEVYIFLFESFLEEFES